MCVFCCLRIFSISNKLAFVQVLYKDCCGGKKKRRGGKMLSFSSLTQPITQRPLTFVFIFFSQQKYLFFQLSILERVSQGRTLIKREASVLTTWKFWVDGLLLARTRKKCGVSPVCVSAFIDRN